MAPDETNGPPEPRIRPDVWALDNWDDTLVWYARAIAAMQARPIADPGSWRFQAAIHAYDRGGDPYADPADQLPSATDQGRFWNQCQHSTWYFLPWHRMYLGYFEQIVGWNVEQLGGPAGWTLPYWNYSDTGNPNAHRIPPAFREATLPDGNPNPLRVEQRVPDANTGGIVADDSDVDIQDCLDETVFVGGAFGGNTGFGGPETAFNHGGGFPPGKLEMTPHGGIHMAVGGSFPLPAGFMSRFNTAGLDPLFWLHHANIDRLWTVWNKRDAANTNPSQPSWRDSPTFEFYNALGSVIGNTCAEVADSASSPFAYRYEDESDPLSLPTEEAVAAPESTGRRPMERTPAEMVGATESKTTLTGGVATAKFGISAPVSPGLEAVDGTATQRVFLNIENIKGLHPVPHLVYVNLPEGAQPADHPERLAGALSMFGLAEASGADPEHAGSGLHYALDITRIADELGADWDPEEIRVTFVPKSEAVLESASLEGVGESVPSIEVGRVSVYRSPR